MGPRITYAYVCGDILHHGHLVALRNAKALGDLLVVGVLTDEAVMEKKPRPVLGFDERLELIASLKVVDLAVPQYTYSPVQNIRNIKPDVLAESLSHSAELLEEVTACMKETGGRVVILPYYPDKSSTKIKDVIRDGNG